MTSHDDLVDAERVVLDALHDVENIETHAHGWNDGDDTANAANTAADGIRELLQAIQDRMRAHADIGPRRAAELP